VLGRIGAGMSPVIRERILARPISTPLGQFDQTLFKQLLPVWTRLLLETSSSVEEAFDDLWGVLVQRDDKWGVAVGVLQIGVRSVVKEPLHHGEVRVSNSRRQHGAESGVNVIDASSRVSSRRLRSEAQRQTSTRDGTPGPRFQGAPKL
jgi:hypothetical protein